MTRNVVASAASGAGGGGGVSLTPSNGNFASGSFGQGLIQVYGVGSHSFTVPAGVTQIRARAWGAGACGGGSFCMKIITGLESGSSIAITVAAGVSHDQTAGATSVGSFMTAGGGSSYNGGTASGGDVNYSGGNGASNYYGAGGVASMFGPGNSTSRAVNGGAVGGYSSNQSSGLNLRDNGRGLSGGSYVYASANTTFSTTYLTPDVPSLTSIDLIGTGIGGASYGMAGSNGGGGGYAGQGGFPGGGGGESDFGAAGLVIVEW